MKILCLSDLHLRMADISDVIHQRRFTPFLQSIRDLVEDTKPDVAVVTGDTVPPPFVNSLNAFFGSLFPAELPVVATLGNHEFWGRPFEETLEEARNQTVEAPNVHILDAEPSVEIDGYNFVGGCLFFDGSMRWRENDTLLPWDGWQDWRITDIEQRYEEFCAFYIERIRKAMKPNMPNVLCTHHLPHVALNGHEPNHYSFYSGVKDLVSQLPFDDAFPNALICGHTHKRVIGEVVKGFYCVNVGSDYGVLMYYLLEM
jgi:predicted MPP superfamily phosphohydrolase